jgi:hypothetical protein
MKTDCINYNYCRLPVELCNDDCERYRVSKTWQEQLLDIANREYYEQNKGGEDAAKESMALLL